MGELFAGKRRRMALVLFWMTLKAAPVWIVPIVAARIIDLDHMEDPRVGWLLLYVAIAVVLFLQNIPTCESGTGCFRIT